MKNSNKFNGFGKALSKPADLLEKLKFDFSRLSQNPCDVYAAYDFFLTAHHLHHWVLPNQDAEKKRRKKHPTFSSMLTHCKWLQAFCTF